MVRFFLFAACVAVTLAGCGKSDPSKPDAGKGGGDPGPGGAPSGGAGGGGAPSSGVDLTTAKADHTATAAAWHAEFKKDPEGSKKKYAGKVIEVTGTVGMFSENEFEKIVFVHLKVGEDILGVRCAQKDPNVWEKASPGTEVTVRGMVPEQAAFPGELMPAVVVKAEKNPAQSISAADLAKQFKDDLPKLKEKFDDKWLYVEGELVSTGKTSLGGPMFTLKGQNGVDVVCNVPGDGAKKVAALKPGQKVKAMGEFSAYAGSKGPGLNSVLFKGL